MIAICCMLTCNMAANAGNDKPIAVNALPVKAQTLLSDHFNNQKVMLATIETGGLSTKAMMWFCRTEPSWNLIRKAISQRLTASREQCQPS